MIGVAQVIGMKPTVSLVFSSGPALREDVGRGLDREESATARRARSRRRPTSGTRGARIAAGTPRASPRTRPALVALLVASAPASQRSRRAGCSCSRRGPCWPQEQPDRTACGRHRTHRRRWPWRLPSSCGCGAASRRTAAVAGRLQRSLQDLRRLAASPSPWVSVGRPFLDRQRGIARPFVPGAEIHPHVLHAGLLEREEGVGGARALEAVEIDRRLRRDADGRAFGEDLAPAT